MHLFKVIQILTSNLTCMKGTCAVDRDKTDILDITSMRKIGNEGMAVDGILWHFKRQGRVYMSQVSMRWKGI